MELKYFEASYCAPCKVVKPQVIQYASKNGFELKFIDIQTDRDTANLYGVTVIPVLSVEENNTKKLYHGKNEIEAFLAKEIILPKKTEVLSFLLRGSISAIGGYITTRLLTKFFTTPQ
jgi:thiol-disulfide isomerase/thioredoxin